ncbi:MAG: glutamine--tRNA ligase/YqeY domain fusion protein [Clostridia bacterium]|nr:glutamine--tRNA ligase/YqeY domain fusion protein [Clostridia bacterium]
MNDTVMASNFIHNIIEEDNEKGAYGGKVYTRFPPEPNGYLHIGHAKAICVDFMTAEKYGGKCNLRFDDTNPVKEDTEYVDSIMEDVKWLGFSWEGEERYASDYFEKMYDYAVFLIKKGKAYVCDLSPEEWKEYKGTLTEPGRKSPYASRSVRENLDLFARMRAGEFSDGERVLRANIDMQSPNMNMRDPVIYRIYHATHHRTGDKWCIYPMYDFAHPLEDAIEGITHSLCTLEFEDHRPLYDWVLRECEIEQPPKQIEFARLELTNNVTSKRKLKLLVDEHIVDGWDDPRMPTVSGLRARGYTPEAIRSFIEKVGVSKSKSEVDYAFLEYCVREDLKLKYPRVMAAIEPIKVIITNYPEDKCEYLEIENNKENEALGTRKVPFTRELYIDRTDFMEEPPKKYFRMFKGNNVRLMGAYIVHCDDFKKNENGEIEEVYCTYIEKTKSGEENADMKVKGVIQWVSAKHGIPVKCNLYDHLFLEKDAANDENSYEKDGMLLNRCSLETVSGFVEPYCEESEFDKFQFVRIGYFCKNTKENNTFNRVVSLKSSFKI